MCKIIHFFLSSSFCFFSSFFLQELFHILYSQLKLNMASNEHNPILHKNCYVKILLIIYVSALKIMAANIYFVAFLYLSLCMKLGHYSRSMLLRTILEITFN